MKKFLALLLATTPALSAAPAQAENAQQVTQYGITWKFDKPYPVGQFVTGDYWVVGPVKVVEVSPSPSPDTTETVTDDVKSRYGAVAMVADGRMRNGSMVVTAPGPNQGYDSRLKNYQPELSVSFPCSLTPNQSLISTISNQTFPVPALLQDLLVKNEKNGAFALKTAAILTCLTTAPPDDAFRPPYVGTQKPIYQAKNLQWDVLPRLKPVEPMPSWEQYERYFERPWLDHITNWMFQYTGPNENQANYGREFSRVTSIASLMLMLDVPQERKRKLMLEFVQFGIDLHALAQTGRQWTGDGGHWNGRKWPILFAGLMLGDKNLQTVPPATLFSEDQQTYFGQGYAGQTALYQIVFHTFPRPPYEEKAPATWDDGDKRSEGYRMVVSGGWPGTALAVQLMKAKSLWNHEAFFAYNDRWMALEDAYAAGRGNVPRPKAEGHTFDPFVDAMWAAYRPTVPTQPAGRDNLKWVWNDDNKTGKFIPQN